MKFYSLSSGLVNHLLLKTQKWKWQTNIISFRKSSFIIRRPGTRITTILTMKLFKNEQNICVASVGVGAAERSHVRDTDVIDGKWVSLEAMSELKSWAASEDIIRFCKPSKCEGEYEVSEGRSYVENSKVSESWLLMKFYLSSGHVNHLLSKSEVDLPMEVADEHMDIISFRKSSFIIRRSGTRKTTILTMKLFQNEQNICVASVGVGAVERSHVTDTDVIHGKWVSLEAMSELKWV
ncbi:hypothetical protein Tco_1486486 [Tanacetum coccineum]